MEMEFYKGKKVFVTGHTGFKGTWLCHTLVQAGAEVMGYALQVPTQPALFEQTKTEERVHSVIADVRNFEKLKETMRNFKPEVVLHLAAQPLVRLSYQQPRETFEINVMGTVNLLEAVKVTPSVQSVVNVTTDKVYENKEWCWGYRENEYLCGFDPYSNSKSCSELVTACYRNSFFTGDENIPVSTARSGNVIGGGDYATDRIIPDCIRAAINKQTINLRNPHSVRPYQHVLDCLAGYLLLAQKQAENHNLAGAYNFGPDELNCISTGDLATLFCTAWGNNMTWKTQGDAGPHEANLLKLDCAKAKNALEWMPKWNVKIAVEKVVEFAQCNSDSERFNCINKQIKEYFQ